MMMHHLLKTMQMSIKNNFDIFNMGCQVWDEAKRLRCEWYNDYEKGITKPPIRVSDLEVVELNFRGRQLGGD